MSPSNDLFMDDSAPLFDDASGFFTTVTTKVE